MAGRQHISLELSDDLTDKADLVQILSNSHINDHFHSLAREVCVVSFADFSLVSKYSTDGNLYIFFLVGHSRTKNAG